MGRNEPNNQDAESDDVRVRAFADDRDRINALRKGTERQPDVIRRLLDAYDEAIAEAEIEMADSFGDVLGDDEVAVVAADGTAQDLADRISGIDPELRDQLNRIESAATAAEDTAGSIQNALEREGIGR